MTARPQRYALAWLVWASTADLACGAPDQPGAGHGLQGETSSTSASEASADTRSSMTGTGTTGDGTTSTDTSTSGADTSSTDAQSGTTGGSSTGLPGPVCGDGVVQGDEACDDGNDTPGDGCQACTGDSLVFITSEVYQGFALGGQYGADLRCQSLAAKARLPRFLTFRAWLSTPTMSAAQRLLHSRGRYVLVNGLVVAHDWDALTSGTLDTPISVDENSETRDWRAWTGTLASGQPALGSEFCGDWDDEAGVTKEGGTGLSLSTDASWSFLDHGPCGSELRLYCVEQRPGPQP